MIPFFLIRITESPVFTSGHCVATVWPLCGHCVATVWPLCGHCDSCTKSHHQSRHCVATCMDSPLGAECSKAVPECFAAPSAYFENTFVFLSKYICIDVYIYIHIDYGIFYVANLAAFSLTLCCVVFILAQGCGLLCRNKTYTKSVAICSPLCCYRNACG